MDDQNSKYQYISRCVQTPTEICSMIIPINHGTRQQVAHIEKSGKNYKLQFRKRDNIVTWWLSPTLCQNMVSLFREACRRYWRDVAPEIRVDLKYKSLPPSTPRIVEITSDEDDDNIESSNSQPLVQFPRSKVIALPFNTSSAVVVRKRRRTTVASLLGDVDYFTCNVCFKPFNRKSNLKRHEAAKHSGHVRLFCAMCSASYKHAYHFADHVRSHDEVQYSCPVCSNTYSSRGALIAHSKKHKNEKNVTQSGLRKDGKPKSAAYDPPHSNQKAVGNVRIPIDFQVVL